MMPLSPARAAICAASMSSVLDLAAVLQLGHFLGRKHLLELGRRLAGLRAVRLVGDDRKALALRRRQFAHRRQREGEGLDRADDDLLAAPPAPSASCRALLPPVRLDRRHHAWSCAGSRRAPPAAGRRSHCGRTRRCTVSNSFLSLASCRSARKCAVQAIELVLPDPAECWIKILARRHPPPARAANSFRVASSW